MYNTQIGNKNNQIKCKILEGSEPSSHTPRPPDQGLVFFYSDQCYQSQHQVREEKTSKRAHQPGSIDLLIMHERKVC